MERTGDISKRSFRLGAGLILLVALALRLWGAIGDLAQDEITSLHLVAKTTRLDQAFWQINNDNSHPLNSAWLFLVGPHAPYLAMRMLSIIASLGAVLAAGLWGARRSYIGGLIAMALFATSYLMVNYGSEARGYAGMILCIVLAAWVVENILAGKGQKRLLGLIALVGTLFHYDMVIAIGLLALACLWRTAEEEPSLIKALDKTLDIFILPLIGVIVAVAPVFITPYTIGHMEMFSPKPFIGADNLALQTALNVPLLMVHYGDLLFAVILALFWFKRHRSDFRALFFVVTILVMPVVLWAFEIPNTNLPRHMILSGVGYILLVASVAEAGWRKGGRIRLLACAGLVVVLAGNGMLLQKFYHYGRGHYGQAVAQMTADGPTTYNIDKQQLTPMIDFYSAKLNVAPPAFVAMEDWCAKGAPLWAIVIHVWPAPLPPEHMKLGPDACQAPYTQQQDYPAWGLTGADWVLFKRGE